MAQNYYVRLVHRRISGPAMLRRIIQVTSVALLAIAMAVLGLLLNLLSGSRLLTEWLNHQRWYSLRNLVLALVTFVVITVVLQLLQQASTQAKKDVAGDPSLPIDPSVRVDLLNRVKTEWVDDRLHPQTGLRKAIRVDLKLTETLDAIKPERRIHITRESGRAEERPTDENIQEIFKKANGQLLILGEPGTGKTNLLMELAQGLVADARHDEKLPIPIVFSLPRWTLGGRWRSLADWMIDDLHDEHQYRLSRGTAEALVRQNRITPLLDGLDEVAEERRAACVDAIHKYQHERDRPELAVCCRVEEYQSLPKLNLWTAIRVEKLTREEVNKYLALDGLARVRRTLQGDQELLEVIDTPLWLHVAVLAAEAKAPAGSERLSPRDRLYARFVEYALERETDWSPRRRTNPEDLKRWLGWLAAAIKRRSQREFALEELDESWVRSHRAARWVSGLVFGLVGGLVFGLAFGLAFALIGGRYPFDQAEELYFDWHDWKTKLRIVGLVSGLGFGLVAGLAVIVQPRPVNRRASPNRGTLHSLRNAAGLLLLLDGLALAIILAGPLPPSVRFLAANLLCGVILAFAFIKGGGFAIRHYVLRIILWREGSAPLQYVPFLNEATERLFLTRRGGSYEFFHLTFRDYMANAYGPKEPRL